MLELNKLYLLDCMEGMAQFPDKYFDLGIVDPPYGIGEDGRKTKGRTFRKNGTARLSIDKRSGRKSLIYNTYKPTEWDNNYPSQIYFDELIRISKRQIIWGENYILFNQKQNSSGRIFWDKINGNNDFSDGEIAWTNLFTSVRQIEFMWNGMLQAGSFKTGRIMEGNVKKRETRIHPTQKPVQLYKWILHNYAKPDFKIIDTHIGSASSIIAFIDFGCDWIGFEIDSDYHAAATKRIEVHKAQLKLF